MLLALAAGCGGGDGGPAAPRPCPSALTGEPERRPPRELALPAGAHVYASEGPFGKTERFFAVVAGRPEDLLTPRDTAADALVAGGCKLLRKDAEPPIEAEAHLDARQAAGERPGDKPVRGKLRLRYTVF